MTQLSTVKIDLEILVRDGKILRCGERYYSLRHVTPAIERLLGHYRNLTAKYAAKVGVGGETLGAISSSLGVYVWDTISSGIKDGLSDAEILDEIIGYWQAGTTPGPSVTALPLPIALGCALMMLETHRARVLHDHDQHADPDNDNPY
jgi:hypothetical protein